MAMHIKHPRRIFCLGGPNSGVLTFMKDLTGTVPSPRSIPFAAHKEQTTAGLTHTYCLHNAYYNASVPIWLDEPTATLAEWKADFLTSDAGEVVRAVGAWVVIFRAGTGGGMEHMPKGWGWEEVREAMQAVKEIIAHAHGGDGDRWDGVCLVVQVPSSLAGFTGGQFGGAEENADCENICWDRGFEFIPLDFSNRKTHEHSGVDKWAEKKGLERVKEALEANDWSSTDEVDFDDQLKEWRQEMGRSHEDVLGFEVEMYDVEKDYKDLQLAMATGAKDATNQDNEEDEALQADELEALMSKLVMVRETSAHMPEAERNRFATKAVKELLKSS